jgi:hypothetical protein
VSDSPFVVLIGGQIGKDPKTGKGWPPNKIMIEYIPEWSERVPFGEKIVLVQSVIRHVDELPMLPSEFYDPADGFDWKDELCLKGKSTWGMSIDSLERETQPYYNDSYGKESPGEADRPDWCVGKMQYASLRGRKAAVAVDQEKSVNTLRYVPSYVSRMTDTPNNDGGKRKFFSEENKKGVKKVALTFQVFAFSSKGPCCGEWYEGVSWQWTKTWIDDRDGSRGTAMFLRDLPRPSKDFLHAFDLFNKVKGFAPG